MAEEKLSSAKAVLLAVQAAVRADLNTLRYLVSRHRSALRLEIILRILLTHLPESLPSLTYVSFLQYLESEDFKEPFNAEIDATSVEHLSPKEANKAVRKLGLLPLAWPDMPTHCLEDPLVQFLIHRSLRIDQISGLISQIPPLLSPFIPRSTYLQNWLITVVLPLVRLSCEYHPDFPRPYAIQEFEALDIESGVRVLLSWTGKERAPSRIGSTVGRDIRGLVGPWLYGNHKPIRPKVRSSSEEIRALTQNYEAPIERLQLTGWYEVYDWIVSTAAWETAVDAIEYWGGPSDIDAGGFADGDLWFDGDEQRHLEVRYARTAMATAYSISEDSMEALDGVHRILKRLSTLLSVSDSVPSIQEAITLLLPVSHVDMLFSREHALYLRHSLLDDNNILTTPNETAMLFLQALLTSAYILGKVGTPTSIRQVGELVLLQEEREQKLAFRRLMASVSNGQRKDNTYWVNSRNQILWLHTWGVEYPSTKGVFSQLSRVDLEAEILKALLMNTRYALAQALYEDSVDSPPLDQDILKSTIISAAMYAYDNATNASRSRGGVKKCDDIMKTFSKTLANSAERVQMNYLISVTDKIGQYRLIFKQGEPFLPVNLRVHRDPITILGKVLDLNPRSYTKITEFIRIGQDMVKADLIPRDRSIEADLSPETSKELCFMAKKRVVSMCIDASLAEDDFETAYSYVVNHLGGFDALDNTPLANQNCTDDYTWRAALQAGKFHFNPQTIQPTHLGSDSGNLQIRHLEHRMQCLGHALRLAPKSTLQEILNVYRRCEEELETQLKSEEKAEFGWDRRANEDNTEMPGGYNTTPYHVGGAKPSGRFGEEAPMSLFDLSRASINRAQSGLSALAMLRHKPGRAANTSAASYEHERKSNSRPDLMEMPIDTPDSSIGQDRDRVRKRDQLKDAAVGTLASGIGWLINAPPQEKVDDQ